MNPKPKSQPKMAGRTNWSLGSAVKNRRLRKAYMKIGFLPDHLEDSPDDEEDRELLAQEAFEDMLEENR